MQIAVTAVVVVVVNVNTERDRERERKVTDAKSWSRDTKLDYMMDIGVLPAAAAQIPKAGVGKYIIINTDKVESEQLVNLFTNIWEGTTYFWLNLSEKVSRPYPRCVFDNLSILLRFGCCWHAMTVSLLND